MFFTGILTGIDLEKLGEFKQWPYCLYCSSTNLPQDQSLSSTPWRKKPADRFKKVKMGWNKRRCLNFWNSGHGTDNHFHNISSILFLKAFQMTVSKKKFKTATITRRQHHVPLFKKFSTSGKGLHQYEWVYLRKNQIPSLYFDITSKKKMI